MSETVLDRPPEEVLAEQQILDLGEIPMVVPTDILDEHQPELDDLTAVDRAQGSLPAHLARELGRQVIWGGGSYFPPTPYRHGHTT